MNIRSVRKKIKSVGNVRKITRAMQLMSAIKMKKAQQLAIEARPYQESIDKIIRRISANLDPQYSRLLNQSSAVNRELTIMISSDKGLCGAFNFNLFRFLLQTKRDCDFITVGKKASLLLTRVGEKVIADFSNQPALTVVSAVFEIALERFLDNTYRQVNLVYNRFISTLKIEPTTETLLPFVFVKPPDEVSLEKSETYLVEPNPRQIIDQLLRSYVEEKIRNAIIQSEAGEHSARMMAMKNATENANDVIYNLTLLRNKIRQEKITNELLDMVTAKASVEAE